MDLLTILLNKIDLTRFRVLYVFPIYMHVGVQSVTLCVCIWGGFSLQGRDGDVRVENLCYEGRVKGKRRVRERKGDLMR